MPVEIGPEWDPAAHDYENAETGSYFPSTGPGREMALVMGLGTLAALAAVGGIVFALGGALGAGVITTETTAVLTTEQIMNIYGITEAEAMIYQSIVRAGGTAGAASVARALQFVADMAVKRFLQNGLSSVAALAAAQAEVVEIQLRAAQNQSVIDAAIIEAQARVNYQSALSLFFASGM